jgi:hypothetical protein
MDPASFSSLVHALIPIVAVLAVFGLPAGIIFIIKNHTLRMKELELESQRMPQSTDQRLLAIEERLAHIEGALTGQAALPATTQDRASLLEGPPDAARLRTR